MHVKKEIRSWWLSSLLLLGILMVNIGCGGDNASVADVIKFGNIEYLRVSQHGGRFITSNDLGPIFAYVQSNTISSNHPLQNGNATTLDPGTPVYRVKGYVPTFRLAAYDQSHTLALYEADTNPYAKKGGDLLDIAGKVQSLHILKDDGETEIKTVTNSIQIQQLVGMILSAPVDQNRPYVDEPHYFLSFHLKDGTVVSRSYGIHSHILDRGILLPELFGQLIDHIVKT